MLSTPFQFVGKDPDSKLGDVEQQLAQHHRDLEHLFLMIGKEVESAPAAAASSSAISSADIKPTGVVPGSYTNPSFQVGEDGRIIQASSNPSPSLSLPASGVVPGTYKLATIVVDAYGRVTAAAQGKPTTVAFLGTLTYPVYNNGGNARGTGAVDWQQSRSAVTQVASGGYSAIIGGQNNTSSGTQSATLGGANNIASGSYSVAFGNGGNASGNYSLAYCGESSGTYSVALGSSSQSSGTGAISIGAAHATSDYAVAIGQSATSAGSYAVSLLGAVAGGTGAIAIGTGVTVDGQYNISIGGTISAWPTGNYIRSSAMFIAPGSSYVASGTTITSYNAIIGYSNSITTAADAASSGRCIVIGNNNTAETNYSVVLGRANTTTGAGSHAFILGLYNSIAASGSSNTACVGVAIGRGNTLTASSSEYPYAFGFNQTVSAGMSIGPSSSSCATGGRLNFGVTSISVNTTVAYNGAVTVRNSTGLGTTTLTFTHGILTRVV